MPTHRETAEKNMTKTEFKLFTQSFPRALKRLPEEKALKALHKTEELVEKYRKSLAKAGDKNLRLMSYRLRTLESTLKRYSRRLQMRSRVKKEKRSLTPQPKMLVSLKDEPREDFLYKEREKIYAHETRGSRNKNSPMSRIGNRISGSMKSQIRKGQIGRDRRKAQREEGE